MSFLAFVLVGTLLAYVPQYFFGNRRDHRSPCAMAWPWRFSSPGLITSCMRTRATCR